MKFQYVIERREPTCWLKVYESAHQDWAENTFAEFIKEYPEDQFRLIKREVIASYNPY